MTLPLVDRYAPRLWDGASTVRPMELRDGSKKDRFDTVDFFLFTLGFFVFFSSDELLLFLQAMKFLVLLRRVLA